LKIVLASQSPWRQKNMATVIRTMGHGDNLEIIPADIDEKAIRDIDPVALTQRVALAKVQALEAHVEPYNTAIVGGDSVVVFGHVIREKPADTQEAREFLRSYAHQPARVVTSTVIAWQSYEKRKRSHPFWDHEVFTDQSVVGFKPFSEDDIDTLIADGVALRSAGAFSVDHPLYDRFVQYIVGDDTAISGLPILWTRESLKRIRSEVI
jgi:septum formation protein